MDRYLNLDFSEIQKVYPRSVKRVIEWFSAREDIVGGLIGMTGGDATRDEILKAMEHVVPMLIQYDPRKLYDFFDSEHIRIYVGGHPNDDNAFVVYNSCTRHSEAASTRAEAEEKGFIGAFQTLETALKEVPDETEKGGDDQKVTGSK